MVNVNQAYEGEELQEPCEVRTVSTQNQGVIILIQAPLAKSKGDGGGYRLKFGQEIYYCKPYRPFHTQLRYNFSGLPSSSSETAGSLFGRGEGLLLGRSFETVS